MKARAGSYPKLLAGLVFDNAGWKLLALAVSVIIWAFVAREPELDMFTSAGLEYKNLPDELEISSPPVDKVSLEITGSSGNLRAISGTAPPEVILDMSNVRPGQRTFPIDDSAVRLPRGVRLLRAVPSAVRFTFELALRRFVPVVPRFTGQGRNGYVVGNWVTNPQQVEITGPASHVARIASVATDPVDVSGVIGTSEFRVNAFLEDSYVRFVSPAQITVTVAMKKQ